MGGAPIVDEQWTAGGAARPTPAAAMAAVAAAARRARTRVERPAVDAGDVRLAVGAVWVATLAEQEARDLGHDRLGTEHLLLALVRLGDTTGRRLTAAGAGLAAVRRLIERDGAPGAMDNVNGRPGWSTAATAAVRAARIAAGADGRAEVLSRDLLVAMLAPAGRAATLLAELGIDVDALLAGPARASAPEPVDEPVTVSGTGRHEAVGREQEPVTAAPVPPPRVPEPHPVPAAAVGDGVGARVA